MQDGLQTGLASRAMLICDLAVIRGTKHNACGALEVETQGSRNRGVAVAP